MKQRSKRRAIPRRTFRARSNQVRAHRRPSSWKPARQTSPSRPRRIAVLFPRHEVTTKKKNGNETSQKGNGITIRAQCMRVESSLPTPTATLRTTFTFPAPGVRAAVASRPRKSAPFSLIQPSPALKPHPRPTFARYWLAIFVWLQAGAEKQKKTIKNDSERKRWLASLLRAWLFRRLMIV